VVTATNAIRAKRKDDRENRRGPIGENIDCGKCDSNSVEDSSVELIFNSCSLRKSQVTGVAIFRGGLKNGNSLVVALTL
jgi:cytochrome c-type biogenesis protein CcmH/NrfF